MDFSIMIPFKNSGNALERAVSSVLRQEGPDSPRFEILLVDTGATSEGSALARRLAEKASVPTRVVDARKQTKVSRALNGGCAWARGDWLALLDADDWVGEGWLQALGRHRRAGRILVAAVSHDLEGQPNNQAAALDPGLGRLGAGFVNTAGFAMTVERKLCERAGGWDPAQASTENHNLVLRLQLHGGRLHGVQEAVYHRTYARSMISMLTRGWRCSQDNVQLSDRVLPLFGVFQFSRNPPLTQLSYRLGRRLAGTIRRSLQQGHPQPFMGFAEEAGQLLSGRRLSSPAQRMAQRESCGEPLRPALDEPTWPFWQQKVPRNVQFLTFDDGPAPDVTDRLLDALRAAGQRATFFLVGRRVAQYPDLVRRMVFEGHEIGNHTYNHYRLHELAPDRLREEIALTQRVIVEIAGEAARPRWFRAPYGRITGDAHLALLEQGLFPVRWSVATGDWHAATTASQIAATVNRVCQPEIFDLHDASEPHPDFVNPEASIDRMRTADALAEILDHARIHGIQFRTLSEVFWPWMRFELAAFLERQRPTFP